MARSFVLSWQLPQTDTLNGVLTGFNIFVQENETGSVYHNTSYNTSIVLNYLHPFYTYHCSVAAVTISAGPFSEVTTVKTSQAGKSIAITFRMLCFSVAPSGPPTYLSLSSMSPNTINISWSPPLTDQWNGIIQYYEIKIHITETLEYLNFQTPNLFLALNDMHPYYTYIVSVAAVTIETGPFSSSQSITTPQDGKIWSLVAVVISLLLLVPTGPPQNLSVNVLSSSSLYILWDHILQTEQNGMILSYTVTVFEENTNTTFGQWSISDLHITVNNLHPHYTYIVYVAGSTVVGSGPSATYEAQTLQAGT